MRNFAQIKRLKFMFQARNNYKCAVIKTCFSRGTTKLHVSCLPMDVLHFNTWKICVGFESESKNHEKTFRRALSFLKLLIHKWVSNRQEKRYHKKTRTANQRRWILYLSYKKRSETICIHWHHRNELISKVIRQAWNQLINLWNTQFKQMHMTLEYFLFDYCLMSNQYTWKTHANMPAFRRKRAN